MTRREIDVQAYERDLIPMLKQILQDQPFGLSLESIELQGTGSPGEIVVLFEHENRPGCRLGFRFPARGTESLNGPLAWAWFAWVHLDEVINESECGRFIAPSPVSRYGGCSPVGWLYNRIFPEG
ncbi:hypothetical protein [Planobispora rosea]|nr:hypothetical protein [Planobispora rosea]